MIIGGFYIPYGLITPVLAWASWISMARYGFSTFIINEFGGRDIPCDGYYIDSGVECPMPGSAVIASYGIEGVWTSIWPNVAMLCVIQVFLRVATYAILRRSK
jgi:ABC-type multidrug transport system permease subunit